MIFTIGHSTHPIERFVTLLQRHGIMLVADVRSSPYSRFNPQFNRERLRTALQDAGIRYLFLGKELGARSKNPECYENHRVSYERLANTQLFKDGLQQLQAKQMTHTVALMCAEKEPLNCHRTILVARHLEEAGISVTHILDDGRSESHASAMSRLQQQLKLPQHDMFRSDAELVQEAYQIQAQRIAYIDKNA